MAKVQQKSEKITAFGGIFFVLDKFDSILSPVSLPVVPATVSAISSSASISVG